MLGRLRYVANMMIDSLGNKAKGLIRTYLGMIVDRLFRLNYGAGLALIIHVHVNNLAAKLKYFAGTTLGILVARELAVVGVDAVRTVRLLYTPV